MDINYFCNLTPLALTWARPFLAVWCILLVFLCFIITTQRAQHKKFHEIEHFLRPGAKVITSNGIGGNVIALFQHTLVIELASGQKKEIPKYLVEHVYQD
ncbi:preprotein translocase subunit YajC [Candidatus Dependentiae bacterium]|nr:preprotein translocase subunit YajC [Candidatus Dependentiae bacterium]